MPTYLDMLKDLYDKRDRMNEFEIGFCQKVNYLLEKKMPITQKQASFLEGLHSRIVDSFGWKTKKREPWEEAILEEERKCSTANSKNNTTA